MTSSLSPQYNSSVRVRFFHHSIVPSTIRDRAPDGQWYPDDHLNRYPYSRYYLALLPSPSRILLAKRLIEKEPILSTALFLLLCSFSSFFHTTLYNIKHSHLIPFLNDISSADEASKEKRATTTWERFICTTIPLPSVIMTHHIYVSYQCSLVWTFTSSIESRYLNFFYFHFPFSLSLHLFIYWATFVDFPINCPFGNSWSLLIDG